MLPQLSIGNQPPLAEKPGSSMAVGLLAWGTQSPLPSSSGSFAKLLAIRLASSIVNTHAACASLKRSPGNVLSTGVSSATHPRTFAWGGGLGEPR